MKNTTDYNYMEAMTESIKEYIKNEVTLSDYSDREELEEYLNDTLWAEDSVTGNATNDRLSAAQTIPFAVCIIVSQ